MAVEGIANVVQIVADQSFGQEQEKQPGTNTLGTRRAGSPAVSEDTFTPSTQNNSAQATAQDAGIFQVSQVALTEVTANILLGQATPNANGNGAPAQAAPAPTTNAGTAQTAATASNDTPANVAQTAGGSAAATPNVQLKLQALNAALPALGLSNAQIQQIDRIASLIQDFNPAAYTNLVNQFEALAQQAAQQSAANGAANASATATSSAGSSANDGGFQVQEILIHFTGSQGTLKNTAANGGGQGSGANNSQITAANLQIEQVQFTLASGSGQTVQVQAPQQNTTSGTAKQQPPQT
jgi:hypothetical protein